MFSAESIEALFDVETLAADIVANLDAQELKIALVALLKLEGSYGREADALMAKRTSAQDSASRAHNARVAIDAHKARTGAAQAKALRHKLIDLRAAKQG